MAINARMDTKPPDRSYMSGLWIVCALASVMSAAVLFKTAWLGDAQPVPVLLTSTGVVLFGAIAVFDRAAQRSSR